MLRTQCCRHFSLGGNQCQEVNHLFVESIKGAEGVIIALTSLANLCVSVNTVAMMEEIISGRMIL